MVPTTKLITERNKHTFRMPKYGIRKAETKSAPIADPKRSEP